MAKSGKHRFDSIILGRINYGEADLIVGFFTREAGKLKGLAKHGRKSRKRFGNALSVSSRVDMTVTMSPGRDLVRLESSELVHSFDGLGQDPVRLGRAGLVLEVVDGFYEPLDPAPEVFDLLVWCLGRIDADRLPDEAVMVFLTKLLDAAGFGFSLTACTLCGRPPGPSHPVCLGIEQNGLVCASCRPGGYPISLGTLKTMALIRQTGLERLDRIRMGEAGVREAGPFITTYLRRQLGRDLKSARFLDSIRKSVS